MHADLDTQVSNLKSCDPFQHFTSNKGYFVLVIFIVSDQKRRTRYNVMCVRAYGCAWFLFLYPNACER